MALFGRRKDAPVDGPFQRLHGPLRSGWIAVPDDPSLDAGAWAAEEVARRCEQMRPPDDDAPSREFSSRLLAVWVEEAQGRFHPDLSSRVNLVFMPDPLGLPLIALGMYVYLHPHEELTPADLPEILAPAEDAVGDVLVEEVVTSAGPAIRRRHVRRVRGEEAADLLQEQLFQIALPPGFPGYVLTQAVWSELSMSAELAVETAAQIDELDLEFRA